MKKFLITLLAIVMSLSMATFFVGCSDSGSNNNEDEGGETHKHTYASEWSYDDTYHWLASTCGHADQIKEKTEHSFGNNGKCVVCQKVNPSDTPSNPDDNTGNNPSDTPSNPDDNTGNNPSDTPSNPDDNTGNNPSDTPSNPDDTNKPEENEPSVPEIEIPTTGEEVTAEQWANAFDFSEIANVGYVITQTDNDFLLVTKIDGDKIYMLQEMTYVSGQEKEYMYQEAVFVKDGETCVEYMRESATAEFMKAEIPVEQFESVKENASMYLIIAAAFQNEFANAKFDAERGAYTLKYETFDVGMGEAFALNNVSCTATFVDGKIADIICSFELAGKAGIIDYDFDNVEITIPTDFVEESVPSNPDDSTGEMNLPFASTTTVEDAVELLEQDGWTVEILSIEDAPQGSVLASLPATVVGVLNIENSDGTVYIGAILFESEQAAKDFYTTIYEESLKQGASIEETKAHIFCVGHWYYNI